MTMQRLTGGVTPDDTRCATVLATPCAAWPSHRRSSRRHIEAHRRCAAGHTGRCALQRTRKCAPGAPRSGAQGVQPEAPEAACHPRGSGRRPGGAAGESAPQRDQAPQRRSPSGGQRPAAPTTRLRRRERCSAARAATGPKGLRSSRLGRPGRFAGRRGRRTRRTAVAARAERLSRRRMCRWHL